MPHEGSVTVAVTAMGVMGSRGIMKPDTASGIQASCQLPGFPSFTLLPVIFAIPMPLIHPDNRRILATIPGLTAIICRSGGRTE